MTLSIFKELEYLFETKWQSQNSDTNNAICKVEDKRPIR